MLQRLVASDWHCDLDWLFVFMEFQKLQYSLEGFGVDFVEMNRRVLGDLSQGFAFVRVLGQQFFLHLELSTFRSDYFEHDVSWFFRGRLWGRLLCLNFFFGSHLPIL